ncbi:MAG TPA: hypothetical protein VNK43_04565 [Gemmatimonadales bacterium]|nr:hypothetical protein [Gemmatimonadales bacterium]
MTSRNRHRAVPTALLLVALAVAGWPAAAQTAQHRAASRAAGAVIRGDSLTTAGAMRASALVDSVYIDRRLPGAVVPGGDFVSYLMARLGVFPIPGDLRILATVDSQRILLHGRIRDIPAAARAELGTLIGMFGEDTPVEAEVVLLRPGPEVVRFQLRSVSLNRMPVPEFMLLSFLKEVGRKYPALTASGRDLYVQVPPNAGMRLVPGGVRLTSPPATGACAAATCP